MMKKDDEEVNQLAVRNPEGAAPPAQTALRDAGLVDHGVRGRGD
jgi:hypothetical protein